MIDKFFSTDWPWILTAAILLMVFAISVKAARKR